MSLPFNRSLTIVAGDELQSWHFDDDATSGQMVRKYYDTANRLRCVEYPDTRRWDLLHYRKDGQISVWEDEQSNWKHYHYDSAGEHVGFAINGDWWHLTDPDHMVYHCAERKLYCCPRRGFEGDFDALLKFLGLDAVVNQLSACTGGPEDPLVLEPAAHAVAKKHWKAFFHIGTYLKSLASLCQ